MGRPKFIKVSHITIMHRSIFILVSHTPCIMIDSSSL
jgi:hypothetical protein